MSDSLRHLVQKLGASLLSDIAEPGSAVSTGNLVIDALLGGGIPCGLITEMVGDFSTGKSLLGLQVCRSAIDAGGIAIYLDSERSLNRKWASTLGVKEQGMIVYEPPDLEDAYTFLLRSIEICHKYEPAVIVWDSLAAISPREDSNPTVLAARINSANLPKLLSGLKESNAALLLINQLRSKIGVLFGKKWESCGGRAVRFYASLRLYLSQVAKVKGGVRCRAEVIKSRLSRPYRHVDFVMRFDVGIEPWSGMIELLKRAGLVSSAGGGWMFKPSDGGESIKFRMVELPQVYRDIWSALSREDIERALGADI